MLETSQAIVWSAAATKSLGADSVSDWIELRKEFNRATLQVIWTGAAAQGTFYVEGRVGQKRSFPIPVCAKTADPDGTVYAGSLSAADLDAEALGESVMRLVDFGCDEIRLGYVRIGGTGTMSAVIHCTPQSGTISLNETWSKEVIVVNLADNATHDIYLPTHIYHVLGSLHLVISDGTGAGLDDITVTAACSNDYSSQNPAALAYGDNSVNILGAASITNAAGAIDLFREFETSFRFMRLRYQRTAGAVDNGDITIRVMLW